MAAVAMVSCSKSAESDVEVDFGKFPEAKSLAGEVRTIECDDVYVPGALAVTDSGYMVYLYDSEYFISVTDTAFRQQRLIAHKGQAPGEVTAVSGSFGRPLDDSGLLSVYDPHAVKMYGYQSGGDGALQEVMAFPTDFAAYAPLSVVRLKTGSYAAPRGDFRYGMVMYDPATSATTLCPTGLKTVDETKPLADHVSMRDMSYSARNGIVAEIYGSMPVVVLHDETGAVVRTITVKSIEPQKKEYDRLSDVFRSVALTDDLIWLLYGDEELMDCAHVLAMSYEGEPRAHYVIKPTSVITIDEKRGLIIAVNPNADDEAIVTYRY
jgi:hypothetical protein